MKKEAKSFIKIIQDLKYPESDKAELATKLLFYGVDGSLKKASSRVGSSALVNIVESNSDIKEAYDAIDGSYLGKKDIKELNELCNSKFRVGPFINEEFYKLVCELLELKGSDLVLHINAPDEVFLTEASKVTKNSTLKINTYAIPDNKYAEDLIRMRLALNDTSYTLVDDEGKLKRFKPNKIFINPSYALLDKDYKYSIKKDKSIWDELLSVVDGMQRNSRIVALIPNVMLSNSLDKDKKREILNRGLLEGIISIPLRYYSTGLTIEVSLLILSSGNTKVRIVDINKVLSTSDIRSAELSSVTEYIADCYKDNYYEVVVKDLVDKDSNLLISNIVTSETYAGIENLKCISQIAFVKKGTKKTLIDFKEDVDQNNDSCYCLLSSNDIEDGIIDYENLVRVIYRPKFDEYIVKEGDLLITNKSTKPKVVVVERRNVKIIPIGGMVVISPNIKYMRGVYLKMFFESNAGISLLSKVKRGQKTNTINPADVEKLMVPCIPIQEQEQLIEAYQKQMKDLIECKSHLKKIQQNIKKLLNKGGQAYGNK